MLVRSDLSEDSPDCLRQLRLVIGQRGKYLFLPPDFKGGVPRGYLTFRSRTYGVFVLWRGIFSGPEAAGRAEKVMEQTRVYRLGKAASAKPMQLPRCFRRTSEHASSQR